MRGGRNLIMEQEKILALILSKLESIEREQQEMKKEQQEMKKEQQGMKKEIFEKLDKIEIRLDRLEEGQESIKEFMFNAEATFAKFERDHIFIEKLKKVAGE